jgi:hypothetical protein
MGDLIVELLVVAFQFLLEVLGQALIEGLVNWFSGFSGRRRAQIAPREAQARIDRHALAVLGWLLGGGVLGALSTLVWEQPFRTLAVRLIALLLVPAGVGLVIGLWSLWRKRRGLVERGLGGFGRGFAFAFGFSLLRYALIPA